MKDTNAEWKLVLVVFGVPESTMCFIVLHLKKCGTLQKQFTHPIPPSGNEISQK